MHFKVSSWDEFTRHWGGVINFLMEGECIPFSFEMPPVERVVEEMRRDPDARIGGSIRYVTQGGADVATSAEESAERFRALPVEDALRSQFTLAHFTLDNFSAPGRLFEGFEEQVMQPWQAALREVGFTWRRCYPIVFVSGPGCSTGYHMDFSHVLAWQHCGTKRFFGFKDPDRWAPLETRVHSAGVPRPAEIPDESVLMYEMKPGTALWNCYLTPHWVEASDEVSYSINISHGGLRLNGQLCRHEEEIEAWRREHPEDARLGLF